MKNAMIALYLGANEKITGAKNFVADEVRRIKDDESGMELLQIILIILFVVIIAAVLWAFLGDWITRLLQQIFDRSQDIDNTTVTPPS
jgi:peptidoglycan/LPS O-acetylase OafA/YrhL